MILYCLPPLSNEKQVYQSQPRPCHNSRVMASDGYEQHGGCTGPRVSVELVCVGKSMTAGELAPREAHKSQPRPLLGRLAQRMDMVGLMIKASYSMLWSHWQEIVGCLLTLSATAVYILCCNSFSFSLCKEKIQFNIQNDNDMTCFC